MADLTRREFVDRACAAVAAGTLGAHRWANAAEATSGKPRVRPNILYALSTGTWGRVTPPGKPLPLLQILDETAAHGFNGVRLTGYPGILKQNNLSIEQLGEELEKRGLIFSTVSFGGSYYDRDKQPEIRTQAREALELHKHFKATALVFFPPSPQPASEEAAALGECFRFWNELGKMALEEYGVRIGLHNHTDTIVENQSQVDRFLEGTDPRYVFCAWDSAHLHLGGCDVVATYRKSIERIIYTDFKDATRDPVKSDYVSPNGERFAGDSHSGKFFNSIQDLGHGQVDFVALMKMLRDRNYRGWINHDLDTIRVSIAESWRIAMGYITSTLDPIYS